MAVASPGAAETIPASDLVPDSFGILTSLAATVLCKHIGDAGLCVVCGSAWPCERVVLAEHNLAVL